MSNTQIVMKLTSEQKQKILDEIKRVCEDEELGYSLVEGWEEKAIELMMEDVLSNLIDGDTISDMWNGGTFEDIIVYDD